MRPLSRNGGFVRCTRCSAPLSGELYNRDEGGRCQRCSAELRVTAFPALYRSPEIPVGGAPAVAEGEASCFYHPQKQAAVPCGSCGRFLCSLCDLELAGRHLCASCIEAARGRGDWTPLITSRLLYDQSALSLAIFPMLFVFPTLVTAPMALYLAIRYWKAPTSLLPRTKLRFVAAILIASAQIAGWTFFFVSLL